MRRFREGSEKKRKDGRLPIFLFCAILLLWSRLLGLACAGDHPFTGPANYGGTGLMETPTARILPEGQFRVGVAQVDPYRFYYGAISPFRFLEIDGRFTEVWVFPPCWKGMGTQRQKHQPQVPGPPGRQVVAGHRPGHHGPSGTRIYASQYIVASKQIYPFDFTIGFGNGRYGKRPLPASMKPSAWRCSGQRLLALGWAGLWRDSVFTVQVFQLDGGVQPHRVREANLRSGPA